jgi:hypothetical protein
MKIISLESTTFKVSDDIYFIVYNLYYVGQNDDLETRTGPIHQDEGSNILIYYHHIAVCSVKWVYR